MGNSVHNEHPQHTPMHPIHPIHPSGYSTSTLSCKMASHQSLSTIITPSICQNYSSSATLQSKSLQSTSSSKLRFTKKKKQKPSNSSNTNNLTPISAHYIDRKDDDDDNNNDNNNDNNDNNINSNKFHLSKKIVKIAADFWNLKINSLSFKDQLVMLHIRR